MPLVSAHPEDGLVVDAYPGAQPQGKHTPPAKYVPAAQKMGCADPPAQPYAGGQGAHAEPVQPAADTRDRLAEYVP